MKDVSYVTKNQYIAAHGKAPKGYGAWAFEMDGQTKSGYVTGTAWGQGTLTVARARALKEFKAENPDVVRVTRIDVLP